MRGRQLVVAGDDKQLPPTDMFQRQLDAGGAGDGNEDGEDLRDYESILDLVKARVREQCRLTWHYRSQDERLIAFSNEEIYDSDLVTFPGRAADSPVRLHLVDGRAAPGQQGSAAEEVERVVELVMEHAERTPSESLGVIAFGERQADRIDMALRQARLQRPDLAEFFSDERSVKDRFFVKNLERVQGDERDVIILSVGFAKNAVGKVRMQFGPLTHERGHRRLNVAVTRARKRMHVVSCLSHRDLDPALASSKHLGPKLLRKFLEFAHHAGDLDLVAHGSLSDTANAFEEQVRSAIERAGIRAHPQWGVSDYRIDLALSHPERPGEMVLAVETDGRSYHSRHSTRDRDRLREEHLSRLGWRFHRIWSTSWFQDPEGELANVQAAWKSACADARLDKDTAAMSAPPTAGDDDRQDDAAVRGPRPRVTSGMAIGDYSDRHLELVFDWLLRDKLELTREERVTQAMTELGFQRRGGNIVRRLRAAHDRVRR
jgi:very-short-patch-repair endonuclease